MNFRVDSRHSGDFLLDGFQRSRDGVAQEGDSEGKKQTESVRMID